MSLKTKISRIIHILFVFSTVACKEEPEEPIAEPDTSSWASNADFPYGDVIEAVSFTVGNKLFIGTGFVFFETFSGYSNVFFSYDVQKNEWSKVADLPSDARESAISFSIGEYGYVGLGKDCLGMGICEHHYFNDLWRYDPSTNSWMEMAEFPGSPRAYSTSFVIGDKAYITGGSSYGDNDLWEYSPAKNQWTKKADYPGNCSNRQVSFSVNGRGFVGFGWSGGTCKDFWEYKPATDQWIQKAEFPGEARYDAFSVALKDKGYLMAGINQTMTDVTYHSDLWEYEPNKEVWTKIEAGFPGKGRVNLVGGAFEDSFMVGLGTQASFYKFPFGIVDFWKFLP
ncbi:hypothetical protein J0A68_21320 [Algoriphagus sp. H41]|uniref:Galactose oxidase, central domain n=1 Tax=Algoriphagus oliviformis TaxID=2811231 RepID=A0ABS3CBJ3_9BACT|nr:kelch repeat-containing protein [Algoriphagus oliviformis]MBN7813511.1 hypothetical protein [Algoriphagus oliviformis]